MKNNLKRLYTLKPKCKILNKFLVFDTETGEKLNDQITWQLRGRPENFIFGCVVGPNIRKEFHSLKELTDFFLDPTYRGWYVFAHNAEYDLNVCYGNIYQLDPNAIFNGKFISATNGNVKFADSLNIFQTSVKKLGAMMGLEKLGMDSGTYKKSNWKNLKEKQRDILGCYRDCEIVYEALIRIFEDSGDIKITQASLSMTYYRRFHQPFIIEHNTNTSYFWDSYFGGRCEALKLGKTNANVIDANSMYPYWMLNSVFPNPKFLKVEKNSDVKYFIQNILPHFEGCVYAEVFHKENWIGYLPVKKDGKLIFPTGNLRGCWNFPEIRFALDHKMIEIKNITKIVYAEGMKKNPFQSYVETLYNKRIASNNDFEIYRIKIFMNSLYGKFAQRITEETIYIENMEKQFDEIQRYQKSGLFIKLIPFNSERLDCFLVLKSQRGINISYSIPSFSSYITSNARVHLLKEVIRMKKYKVVYMDTDSIFYELEPPGFVSSKSLGGWKKENKIVTDIKGLKNYKYIDLEKDSQKIIHRIKGVPLLNDETIIFDGKEFKKSEKLAENSYRYFNLVKTKESLRRNLDPGILTKRTKEISEKYDKRIILTDGETKPINL
jgi:hypothetical protein